MIYIYALLAVFGLNASVALGASDDKIDFRFIKGCWVGKLNGAVVEKQWGSPEGGLMLGSSKTIRDGKVVSSEFLKISIQDQEAIFTSFLGAKEGSSFKLVTTASNSETLVFEKNDNDFPKRISYFKGDDTLVIILTDVAEKKVEYALDAVSCL